MAAIGLSEAARLTGKNQSTIHRAMKTGRLSYMVDEAGERRIDTAELDRVFRITKTDARASLNGASPHALAQPVQSKIAHEPESERVIAAQAKTIELQDATIRHLRATLDAAERREERLTALLTHRQPGSVPSVSPRPPWWRRWLR